MKIAIIGGGNMGGAIARGLVKGTKVKAADITIADPSEQLREKLCTDCSGIRTTRDNQEAVGGAELVLLAVKPWLMKEVLTSLTLDYNRQVIVSIAAGVSFEELISWTDGSATLFRLVPNTAIAELQSMTLIASYQAAPEQEQLLLDMFNEMGLAMLITEKQIPATTALTSCGVAYVFKYIQASMQAGIEMDIYQKDAMKMVAQSVKGAAEIILNNETHPAVEIDKVTTPGGITIKGINELDHAGFTSAVIRAMKVSGQ
ncbi:MAG: pyrroline-5-carboxylate reductase [Bacteroides sp.]|nr:pyrroline-5-carboxylate reductase [Bacteroides sp.]